MVVHEPIGRRLSTGKQVISRTKPVHLGRGPRRRGGHGQCNRGPVLVRV